MNYNLFMLYIVALILLGCFIVWGILHEEELIRFEDEIKLKIIKGVFRK